MAVENLVGGRMLEVCGTREMYEICAGKWESVLIRDAEYSGAFDLVIVNAKNS